MGCACQRVREREGATDVQMKVDTACMRTLWESWMESEGKVSVLPEDAVIGEAVENRCDLLRQGNFRVSRLIFPRGQSIK